LPLLDQLRAEAAVPVAGHLDRYRSGLGQHRLLPGAVTRVTAVAPGRVVLAIAEMIIHLALDRGLHDPLGQPGQQPAFAGELQPLRPGTIGQLFDELLIHGIQPVPVRLGDPSRLALFHFSHKCLLDQELHRSTYSPSENFRVGCAEAWLRWS